MHNAKNFTRYLMFITLLLPLNLTHNRRKKRPHPDNHRKTACLFNKKTREANNAGRARINEIELLFTCGLRSLESFFKKFLTNYTNNS